MKFDSVIELGGKTATGFRVPEEIVDALGSGKKPPVRITINGYTYRTTVAPRGGAFYLPLSAVNREGVGVAAGDRVDVEIELDTEPRVVTVPADFAEALSKDPVAKRFFDTLSYSHQNAHVQAIDAAKAAETRLRRIDKALIMLREGKKL